MYIRAFKCAVVCSLALLQDQVQIHLVHYVMAERNILKDISQNILKALGLTRIGNVSVLFLATIAQFTQGTRKTSLRKPLASANNLSKYTSSDYIRVLESSIQFNEQLFLPFYTVSYTSCNMYYRHVGIYLNLTLMREIEFDKGCDEAYACHNYHNQCLS